MSNPSHCLETRTYRLYTYIVMSKPTLSLARNVKNLGNSLCDTKIDIGRKSALYTEKRQK